MAAKKKVAKKVAKKVTKKKVVAVSRSQQRRLERQTGEDVMLVARDLGPAREHCLRYLEKQPQASELYLGCDARMREDIRAWLGKELSGGD